jgi:hypothetical protein
VLTLLRFLLVVGMMGLGTVCESNGEQAHVV